MKAVFREPFRGEFADLIRQGAGTLDIQDDQKGPFAEEIRAPERLVQREIDRVDVHVNSLCRLIAPYVDARSNILDVGCGTGATTVAMALAFPQAKLLGVDPNAFSIRASEVRARGYEAVNGRIAFATTSARDPLPFADESFDLVTCVSVVEYIGSPSARAAVIADLVRVVRSDGYVVLITPNPFRLFDYHTHRLLGDWRRSEGYPWASSPRALRKMLSGCDVRFLRGEQIALGLAKASIPGASLGRLLAPLGYLIEWQKVVARKRR